MRTPGLSLALLLTIGLGIGGTVCLYAFVRGSITSDSSLASVDRIVSVFGRDAHHQAGPISSQDYLSLQTRPDVFEWIGTARVSPASVTVADHSAVMSVAAVTPHLGVVLNLSLGDGIVISHRVWLSEFNAKADVRGEQLCIDGVNVRVAGVAPSWLDGLYRDRAVDLWMPLREEARQGDGGNRNFWVLGRLRRNVSPDQAQIAVRASGVGTSEISVLPYTGMTPEMAAEFARVGTLLGFAAGLVFCITCANVVSFLLGHASARWHETSLRIALGASRSQLARERLADSVVISAAGGFAGMLLAAWASHVLPALLFEQDAEHLVFAPDLLSIVAESAAGVGITIACGLLPVFAITHDRPAAVLQRHSAGPSKAIRRVRKGLVVAQMTSCCVLVISTASLFDGLHTALQTSIGRRLGHPILATVQAHPDVTMKYFRDVQRATHLVKGVSETAWASRLPGDQPTWQSFRIDRAGSSLREVKMDIAVFTADSLALFSVPPLAGRLFGAADQKCRIAVVNEEAAEGLFGSETIGRSIRDPAGLAVEIIGVLARRKGEPKRSRPTIYYYRPDQTRLSLHSAASEHFRVPAAAKLERAELDANIVSASYFSAMGFSVAAGQIFSEDPGRHECRVGVINQEAADVYFKGKAVGAALIDESGRRTEIIGVVHSAQLGSFQRRVEPAIYFPMAQDYLPRMALTLILGAREVNDAMLVELRKKIESVPGRGPGPLTCRSA